MKPRHDEAVALLILSLEGCTFEDGGRTHKYLIYHPNLPGIGIACDSYGVAFEIFKETFKVIK